METALLSVRDNNFKDEMMRRLSSIDSDKIKIETRLDKIEENKTRNLSYSFKEELCQNKCADGYLMNFLGKNKVNDTSINDELKNSSEESEVEVCSEESEVTFLIK